jgi:hypothetical protein
MTTTTPVFDKQDQYDRIIAGAMDGEKVLQSSPGCLGLLLGGAAGPEGVRVLAVAVVRRVDPDAVDEERLAGLVQLDRRDPVEHPPGPRVLV